jgi:peptidoglycan/xylan/chitin deacetylase (PgdA/CDA1 family)
MLILPLLLILAAVPPLPYTTETIDGKKHKIYWSVDDHPCRGTPGMLATFKKYKIRATFFVNGWGVRYYYRAPQYKPNRRFYDRMVSIHRHGHLLGNHSVTHRNMCQLPTSLIRWEITENQRLVKQVTGVTMKWWRPPHGIRCSKLRREVRRTGLKTLMWNVADYRRSAAYMYWWVRRRVRRKHTSTVVLFHCQPYKLRQFIRLVRP